MKSSLKFLPLAAMLVLGAASVSAQAPAPIPAASNPTKVGVTPQDAAEATKKAVQRKDTATVVRTSPTAEEKAKAAMANDAPMTNTPTTSATSTMPDATTTTTTAPAPVKRAARADRN